MRTFYYSIDDNNPMTIYDSRERKVADISDCDKKTMDYLYLIEDTLYGMGIIGRCEEVNIHKHH